MLKSSCALLGILAGTLLMTASVQSANATVIAIADSGTDVNHPALVKKIWTNPKEADDAVDDDDDGKIGDVHGWNFVDQNNHYINKKLLGTFGPEIYKFFDVQTRLIKKTATQADKDWLQSKRKDEAFWTSLNAFGNFVHGSHVAGISSKDADGARMLALKIIGTKTLYRFQSVVQSAIRSEPRALGLTDSKLREKAIRFGLDYLAKAQGAALGPIGTYIGEKDAKVVNCSFGMSVAELTPVLKPLLLLIDSKMTDAEVAQYVYYTVVQITKVMQDSFVLAAPHALFVIAAGNDGTNNDEKPASPANVKTDNAMTVAATLDNTSLAYFSNYGRDMVDIAAPGVGIVSTIPGNQYLLLSGTSQATPEITNIAGQILDENPKLSPGDVKRILMDTVDHQTWLEGKVKSEGTANRERALYAAHASLSMNLSSAIAAAKSSIHSPQAFVRTDLNISRDIYVVPLPSTLQ